MEIKWEELFLKSRTVFQCETEEIANEFLKIAHDLGYKWCDDDSYLLSNHWNSYKEETCYDIYYGMFADVECFINEYDNYTIINVKELLTGRKPFKLKRK